MNHSKLYINIIENAKLKNRIRLHKNNPNYFYYESHHIRPKCMGGTNDKENLVLLTAREHYVCHKLLTYIYPKNRKLVEAFWRMTFNKQGKHDISSKDYAYAKELISSTPISDDSREKNRKAHIGKKQSEETKEKRAKKLKGENNGMFGNGIVISGKKNPMYAKTVYSVWFEKYGKEEADKKYLQWKENCKISSKNKNKGNKSVHNSWIEKYGKEKADEKYIEYVHKISTTLKNKLK